MAIALLPLVNCSKVEKHLMRIYVDILILSGNVFDKIKMSITLCDHLNTAGKWAERQKEREVEELGEREGE